MKFILFTSLFILGFSTINLAQDTHRNISAVRTGAPVRINGVLDEQEWMEAPVATDFIQVDPYNGKPSNYKTEVRALYDNSAIYIGAIMYDPCPDSIMTQIGLRDSEWLNADDFIVAFSPFNDGLNAFVFQVYASDVQADFKITNNNEDYSWDAVWQSKASINKEGWIAEIRIPYSAIRFPKDSIQQWGLHYIRNMRRVREKSSWNFIDTKVEGEINQSGTLKGLTNLKPPLRLSLTPYVSGYVKQDPGSNSWNFSYNYGADLKLGLTQSFTLDMTLIPDFGQVQSDDIVYNFSPFEIQYEERRQFFTEGTELFNKGGVFYTRRIGALPKGHDDLEDQLSPGEEITDNPLQTTLINATKISGYTDKNLGIGFFNAMSGNTWATVKDSSGATRRVLTQGFTNYNMLVASQGLKNNSYVSVLNTNLFIPDDGYSANVSGIDFKLANNKYTYGISGNAFLSQIFTEAQAPDRGYHYLLDFEKLSGNFRFSYKQLMETDTYNPNDMGFNARNNKFNHELELQYNIYEPFGKFLTNFNRFYIFSNNLYDDFQFSSLIFRGETVFNTKNYFTFGGNNEFSLFNSYDYYEPRVEGWYYQEPPWGNLAVWISSDYRKRFILDGAVAGYVAPETNSYAYAIQLEPRYQSKSRLVISYELESEFLYNTQGYVLDSLNSSGETVILFGRRDVRTITNVIEASYMFTSTMSLNFRARHYWVTADYTQFYDLQKDGTLQNSTYEGNENISYNLFNIDMSYIWNFLPGSQISVVWKNAINSEEDVIEYNFFKNVGNTFSTAASNSFSIRILIYLDALYFKKRK